MSCSHYTCVLTLLIVWASAAVNSNALDSSVGHESHSGISETFYWPHSSDKRNAQQVCGTRLIATLRALCHGRYAIARRSSEPAIRGLEESDYHESNNNDLTDSAYGPHEVETYPQNDFDLMWPYNPKLLALKVITEGATHQRFRRSVIEECCKKPCTQSEMVKYCGS